MNPYKSDKQHVWSSIWLPLLFVALIWTIKIVETLSGMQWTALGVYPRDPSGLLGILTYPLVHGSWEHLLSNTMPLLVLGSLLMHSYRAVAGRVLPIIYVASGLGIWLFGRQSHHIGASGLVYGLAFFLFFSGIWRKDRPSMALAAFVAIFYGGMTWGLYPMEEGISWEGHLAGAIIGTICAYKYRHINPPPRYDWETSPNPIEGEIIIEHPFWVPLPAEPEPDTEDTPTDSGPTPTAPNPLQNWELKYHFVPHNQQPPPPPEP
ncbi:MAG: rhomboid family intramembrane serine protease [Sphingobacteriales bacterium]|nr:rhomboid family intramembrane serine protease [Sphingobacteriales bacterium]MCC7223343.1 rhomboid family intramembrane serine protease [Chitinophagales bacterium]